MAEPVRIKPESGTEDAFVEDELDESTDLEFYDKNPPTGINFNSLYMARLPAYLWQAWSQLKDDDEIQIGTIRAWKTPDGKDVSLLRECGPDDQGFGCVFWSIADCHCALLKQKLQMRLNEDLPVHNNLPKEYNLDSVNTNVNSTFIFTEQDLPSYAAKNKERAAALAQGIPGHLIRQQQKQMEPPQEGGQRYKKGQPYTRRAIPKKTTIAGTVTHELNCLPLENAETNYYLSTRAAEFQAPKNKIQVMDRLPPNGMNSPSAWSNFFVCTTQHIILLSDTNHNKQKTTGEKPTKAKKMDNKTARWPENVLLDNIVQCFSEHKYWSIKAFRGRIQQPEAYIRELLERVATLHRSGSFANHWSLKEAYQNMLKEKNLAAPDVEDAADPAAAGGDDDDDEEEDIKMEDVL